MPTFLQEARRVAIGVAEAAGDLLRSKAERRFHVWPKSDRDLVTELDYAAEELIFKQLRNAYPDHQIISEEAGVLPGVGQWSWLVDPLDGTNNIALGLAIYTVGLSLCKGSLPVVSVVHDPVSRRTWSAVRGQGAYLGRDLPLKRRSRVGSREVLAWSQGYGVSPQDSTAVALKLILDREATRVLRLWAPLMAWIMLARGDLDGIVGYRIGEIDLHSGALIATEAGLKVCDPTGFPFDSEFRSLQENRSLIAGANDRIPRLVELWLAADKIRAHIDDFWRDYTPVKSKPF
ncbi:inositol monophosphatase family protein [Actinoallomurus bryophytorum]|uniref:Myo-inositol-1(Or 4)-monophosphatase n=1 Tax=Actinoallomurus bryophytorum TaxID=1490222 RepID=A0A543CKW3_9ACTN|nr:inositol monophosphatase family protein [Actinoallomurus bryophytorum]TQL97719.1 myo-inositol-1(or 4)-monophosphatase [Actinoallomurus bryophytorum]